MKLALVLLPLVAAASAATSTKMVRHPHNPKKVTMWLSMEDDAKTVSVSHLTVTFNQEGFENMADGGVWHLANGRFETEADLVVGGHEVAAGEYRLLARKAGDAWELVLDPNGKPFSRQLSEESFALDTQFVDGQPRQEHLRLDIQPSGDKEHTGLRLEVHFDTFVASASIEMPE